jgi:Uncharacterised nucleotidyltransferase/Transglutaminase-like superfamily
MEIARKLRDNFDSPQDILLFGRIFLLITVLPLMVKFLPLPRLMKFLSRNTSGAGIGNTEDYRNRIIRFTDYLLARNFWIYRKTCLRRALVLYHFLCPTLTDFGICFGVRERRDASGDKPRNLDGHAWLVHKGEVFLEEKPDVAKKYIVTYRFPENPTGRKVSSNNFANLSGENRLLLYCSQADIPGEKTSELNDLLSSPLDWKFISEAAHSHNISPLLYYNLKGLSNSSLIPATAMKDLKNVYHETTARNMFMYAELQTILDAFHRAGLETIALKGVALAGVVYPDIGLRPMADIDLLVREEELTVADRVMTDLDYSAIHGLKSQQWYRENHFHLPPYRHVRKPVIVEIHWRITRNLHGTYISKWWERAVGRDPMGYPILVPSPEDMLIHLSVHLFKHGYDNGFVLRGLCDIFETLRRYADEIDWKLLQDEIREQGIEKQVHSILQLARKFYAPLDGSFIPINLDHADYRFLQVLEGSLFVDSGDAPINPHLLKSMMFDNFPKRITYLLSMIFPSRQQMAERYPASPSSMMMFFYYLVRPFHLLARYGKSAARIFRTGTNGRNDGEL